MLAQVRHLQAVGWISGRVGRSAPGAGVATGRFLPHPDQHCVKGCHEILSAALAYAERGWAVLPLWWVRSDGRCACNNLNCPVLSAISLAWLRRRAPGGALRLPRGGGLQRPALSCLMPGRPRLRCSMMPSSLSPVARTIAGGTGDGA
jgi:hypothetical protein